MEEAGDQCQVALADGGVADVVYALEADDRVLARGRVEHAAERLVYRRRALLDHL